MPESSRLSSGLAALVVAVAAALALLHARGLGFPDGHLTEWERALRPLLRGWAGLSLAVAAALAVVAARGARRGMTLALVWAALSAAGWALTAWALSGLEHGQGG